MLALLLAVIERVDDQEDREQETNRQRPQRPHMLAYPPEGDAFEVPQEEWGVADGGERAADIGDDENEEDDVVGLDVAAIHAQERADEEHGSPRGAEDVGDQGADQ